MLYLKSPSIYAKIIMGAALVLVACAFLPWATVSVLGYSASANGIDNGDGWLLIITAVLVAASVFSKKPLLTLCLSVGPLLITVYNIIDITNKATDAISKAGVVGMSAGVGYGLYLANAAAAMVCASAGLWLYNNRVARQL